MAAISNNSAKKKKQSESSKDDDDDDVVYSYNDIVLLEDGRKGKIKFIGTFGFQSDIWFGLILSTPTGSHNGTVKNRQYWHCKPNHGTFVKRNQIKHVAIPRMGARFAIHEKVKTPKGKAFIRFIGTIHDKKKLHKHSKSNKNTNKTPQIEEYHEDAHKDDNNETIYGVELIDQIGENGGFIDNEYYFSCAHFRGMFYTEEEIVWIPPDAPPTPRVTSKKRKKLKNRSKKTKRKQARDKINAQIAPELVQSAKDEMEIIGLDENNQSIDFDASISDEDDSDSLSDSSSDEEYLSNSDMKRISLSAHQIDDRMSFARILSDFKHVQKTNVRSIAAKYENLTKTKQRNSENIHNKKNKEAEIAQEVIKTAKRQRAETLPHGHKPNGTPVYHPPRFADKPIDTSKQYKNRKNTMPLKKRTPQSTPVSPRGGNLNNNDDDHHPPSNPILTNQSQSTKGPFNKVQPPGRKKGTSKRGKKRRKVQFDEVGSSATSSTPSSTSFYYDGSASMPTTPMTLSPTTSLHHHDTHTIAEEPGIEQEEPIEHSNHIFDTSTATNPDSVRMPFSKISTSTSPKSRNKSRSPPNKRVASVPITKSNSANKPPPLTSIGGNHHHHRSMASNGSSNSDVSLNNDGYTSPGIISPGGGMPSLHLQNSHSLDATNDDAVAVVEDLKLNNKDIASHANTKNNHHNQMVESPKEDTLKSPKKNAIKSPSAENVYSWVFKPADEKDKLDAIEFKLKPKPDSPFDVSSTHREFQRVCETLMLECNNPKNLFKVLKGVCAKLKLPNPKYRRIDIKNSAVQTKLLQFQGAEDFLMLLGFKQTVKNPNFWVCDMDQPPLSVLENAITVCNDCLLKCNHKRATIDMIKKFSKQELHSQKKRHKRYKRKRSSKKLLKSNKSSSKLNKSHSTMDTLNENVETPSPSPDPLNNKNGVDSPNLNAPYFKLQLSLSVDGTINLNNPSTSDDEKRNKLTPTTTTTTNGGGAGGAANIRTTHLSPQDSFDIDCNDGAIPALFDDVSNVSSVEDANSPYSSNNNNLNVGNLTLPSNGNLSSALRTASIRVDDATETLDEMKFEQELEGGDEDRFQLSDIIWSITHKDNSDKEARAIILLCFPTFSDSYKLFRCLVERFFEPDESKIAVFSEETTSSTRRTSISSSMEDSHSGNHSPKSSTLTTASNASYLNMHASHGGYQRIESLWEVQAKVVQILKQWISTYWMEDWDQNDRLLDLVDKFCEKIENCYKNDVSMKKTDIQKGSTLVNIITKAMAKQEASLISERRKNALGIRQGSVPMKFSSVSDMGNVVKKMRYEFVKLDNRHLAEQITLLDFKYFRAIKQRECLGQAWKKQNKYEIAPNICALIDQFNKMSRWVQATILLAKNVKRRGRLIKKFIKVMNELLALRNFQSLCAFWGALVSVPIHRLKDAWDRVPAKHRVRFEEMKTIFLTDSGMANLRRLHREAHAPLVPYTGIFLTDLVLIEESNKGHKDDGSVNFAKLMRLSQAIDNILLFQRTTYEVADDIAVQSLLLEDFKTNDKLDAEYMYKFSVDVAKKDKPLKKKSMLSLFTSKK